MGKPERDAPDGTWQLGGLLCRKTRPLPFRQGERETVSQRTRAHPAKTRCAFDLCQNSKNRGANLSALVGMLGLVSANRKARKMLRSFQNESELLVSFSTGFEPSKIVSNPVEQSVSVLF